MIDWSLRKSWKSSSCFLSGSIRVFVEPIRRTSRSEIWPSDEGRADRMWRHSWSENDSTVANRLFFFRTTNAPDRPISQFASVNCAPGKRKTMRVQGGRGYRWSREKETGGIKEYTQKWARGQDYEKGKVWKED